MTNPNIVMNNIDNFINDKKYDYCIKLKDHLIKIKDNAKPSKSYSKAPGQKDLKRLNELLFYYNIEDKGLVIYNDFLMNYPNDIVVKTGNADLIVKMDGRIDEALQLYYDAIVTTDKVDFKFYNIYNRIIIHEILNNKDEYTVNKLPHIKKKNFNSNQFNKHQDNLKKLKELVYSNDNQDEIESLKSFYDILMYEDKSKAVSFFYHASNVTMLKNKEKLIADILGVYNCKKTILNDINELNDSKKYNFEDIHYFCTRINEEFSKLIKEIYTSKSIRLKEYRELINILNSKNNDYYNRYDLIFKLINNVKDKYIVNILHKVIINIFEFEYVKKFSSYIGRLDKDIFYNTELISDFISLSLEYYNDDKDYYITYGNLLIAVQNFELAQTYFKKANDIQFSNSAKLMELYCSLCVMGDKQYIEYKMEDLSYIIQAMKNIALNKNDSRYLYKLNELLRTKKDPLIEISSAFTNALEGKPLLEEELLRLKNVVGDSEGAFLQAIKKVSEKTNYNNKLKKDKEFDFSTITLSNENKYDIDGICEYLFSKENFNDLNEILKYLPVLKENILKADKNMNLELLEKEIKGVKKIENKDIYFLESFKSKCLQLMNYALTKNNSNVFCDYGHRYYETVNITNIKNISNITLQNSFESIVFYEFRDKIKNDPQEHFQNPFRLILNYFEELPEFDKLEETVVYFYYLYQFFNIKGVEDRSNIKIQDLNIIKRLMDLSKKVNEYINSDSLDTKRTIINDLIKTTEKLINDINFEFKGESVGTRKFNGNYKNIYTNFIRLFNYEKDKLRKEVKLDIKLLNNKNNITKDDLLHLYLTNLGDEDANNINISIDLLKDGQIKDSKRVTLKDLRRQNSIGFNIRFIDLDVGKYSMNFVIYYAEGIIDNQFSTKLEIEISESQYTYTRVRSNIYMTDPAGFSGAYFYGRQDEIEEIEDNLFYDGSHSIFIRGLRRVGKSSLLNRVKSSFVDKCFSIICDCQAIMANNSEELIYNAFIKKIIAEFNILNQKLDNKITVDNMNFEEFLELPGNAIDKFDNFLRDLESKIGDKVILILIDEFEGLLNVRDGEVESLLYYFRSILGDKSRSIHFIFAGGEDIISRNEVSVTRIADSSVNIRLGFLNKNAAIELIEGPGKGVITYAPESIEKIIYYTKGHPFYIVQICINLIRKLNADKKKNIIYPDDVQYSVEEVVKEGLFDNIEEIIVDPCERAIIILLGTFLAHRDEGVNINSIIKIFKEFNDVFNIKDRYYEDDVIGSAERLVDKNVLERATDGRINYYRFSVELWRMWYKNNCVSKWNIWLKSNNIDTEFPLERFRSEIYIKEWRNLRG